MWENGINYRSLYIELLSDNASIKPFEVTGTALGGTQKYHTDGTHEYRLEVKTAFNPTAGKCECPAISGRASVDKNGTAHTDGSVYETINSTYGENIDSEFGCTYKMHSVLFRFYRDSSVIDYTDINTIKPSLERTQQEVPAVIATKTYWECEWAKPDDYTGVVWSNIKLKPNKQMSTQNQGDDSLSPGQFNQFFVSELPQSLADYDKYFYFNCTEK